MPNPIGNMVIKVDLDGSGFNRGVTGLNRQMKMVSRSFRLIYHNFLDMIIH